MRHGLPTCRTRGVSVVDSEARAVQCPGRGERSARTTHVRGGWGEGRGSSDDERRGRGEDGECGERHRGCFFG